MERSTRFSFRRKGSQHNKEKDKESANSGFDYDKLSFVSQKVSRDIFEELSTEYTLSQDQLFELIGYSCAVAVAKVYPKSLLTKGKGSVLVCCGPGKNGAEGLVCARHLKLFGYRPTIFYPKPANKSMYQNFASQCEKTDIPFLYYLPSEAQLITDSYSLIVDAIFGCNYERPTSSDFVTIIQTLIKSRVPVASLHVPSGWDDESYPTSTSDDNYIQPEMLVSLLVPQICSKFFKGKHHYLGCHLILPPDLQKKFDLCLPSFKDPDPCVELQKWSADDTTSAANDDIGSGCCKVGKKDPTVTSSSLLAATPDNGYAYNKDEFS